MPRWAAALLVMCLTLLPWGLNDQPAAALIAPVVPEEPARRVPAPGMFLVATRFFLDPHFGHSVIYLLQHDAHASFGVVVNRPLGAKLAERLPEVEGTVLSSQPLYNGGPVNPEMLVTLVESRTREPHDDIALVRHIVGGVFASVNPLQIALI